MTPFAFARAECPNLSADGHCLRLIERPELHDYALPLPSWLSPERWAELVQAARAAGETAICIRVQQTPGGVRIDQEPASKPQGSDWREWVYGSKGLPGYLVDPAKSPPKQPGQRFDLYFCPVCGARIGCRGKLPEKLPSGLALGASCGACSPVKRARASAGCLVHRGARCRYFERCILPLADRGDPKDEPGLQARRLAARQAYLDGLAPKETPRTTADPSRACPDCRGPLGPRRRYCPTCARRRRRQSNRGKKQRWRQKPPEVLSTT
jgi:hypothetical protein